MKKLIILTLSIFSCVISFSQYGVIDPDFLPGDNGPSASEGIIGTVHSIAVQPDGKILVGGAIYRCHNVPRIGIVRLFADGSFDPSFQASIEEVGNFVVNQTIVLPDGKILIAGDFQIGSCFNLARLNNDGSLDESFNNQLPTDSEIKDMVLLSDGRLLISGGFASVLGETRNGSAILLENGDLDPGYIPGNATGLTVHSICCQPDGKILLGLASNGFGTVRRLNADGTVDNGFDLSGTNTSSGSEIYDLQVQPDGKILASGHILTGNYQINGVVRLNPDGTRDLNFTSVASYDTWSSRTINALLQLEDGTFLIAGRSTSDVVMIHILEDGSHDFSYECDADMDLQGSNTNIRALCRVENNILVGGLFLYSEFSLRNNLMEIDHNGKVVPSFCVQPGSNGPVYQMTPFNDQIIVSGLFNEFNGYKRTGIARLNHDGSVDSTFNYEGPDYGYIPAFAIQSDGKVIIPWGEELKRLNSDGSLDDGFSGAVYDGTIVKIKTTNQDQIYSVAENSVLRFNADGSPDNSFSVITTNGMITDFGIAADGKMIMTGIFTQVNGTAAENIVRLNYNGSIDDSFEFDQTYLANSLLTYIDLFFQDNKIIFNALGQNAGVTTSDKTFRLSSNGDRDTSFNLSSNGQTYPPRVIGVQPDGKLMSLFYTNVIRFLPNGLRDYSFPSRQVTFSNSALITTVVSDEEFLLAGQYFSYNGQEKNNIMRGKNCPGAIYTHHISTYDESYTWTNGLSYTQNIEGVIQSFEIPGQCDSTAILDLVLFDPEIYLYTVPSAIDSCSGIVSLSMNGASPYMFDIGVNSTFGDQAVFTDLCPGIYNAVVIDNLGNTFSTNFVVPADSNYYLYNPFDEIIIILDSISFTSETCNVDFESISEIYIDSYEALNPNEVLINWAIIDNSDTTIIPAIYNFYLGEGNYSIQLHIYCPVKSGPLSFVSATDVYFDGIGISTLSTEETSLKSLTLFPNPTENEISINFSQVTGSLVISDLNGKKLLSRNVVSTEKIDLSGFADGVYLFELTTSERKSMQRVVKN